MTVLVWLTPQTWVACVDTARSLAPAGAPVTLLAVADTGPAGAAHGAFSGLLGRGGADPGQRLAELAGQEAGDMLDAAAARLGRPTDRVLRHGPAEREVTTAAQDATLLVVARDGPGDGPRSLGKAVRFVVDHAPCAVLLIWPDGPGR